MAWVPARFDTVRAFRVEQRAGGMTTRAWIDAQGHIVRAENAVGFAMERTAFELAYTNFRHRDTTSLIRASLSPGPGEVVATTVRAARRIADWVRANLAQRPTATSPGALQALEARLGDCNEHAVLYVALARAAGLPARTAAGLVAVDGRFYYHAWAEVYLGDWVAVDPMLDEFPAGAAHVRFSIGGLAQQAELVRLIGRIKLEVL